MSSKFTSTVTGASVFIIITGLLGRGFGLIREVVFANFFGLTVQFDLYLVGIVLPVTINTIILYIAQNYFIPNYHRIKKDSPVELKGFVSRVSGLFTAASVIIALLLYILAEDILRIYLQGSTGQRLEATVLVFRIFILTIPLNALISVLSAFLQSEHEFRYPSISQLFLNIAVIILVVFFSGKFGIYVIPAGYVIGTVIQLVYLFIKSGGRNSFSFKGVFKGNKLLPIVNSSFILIVLIEIISQLYLLADRFLYEYVDKGGIAALNYAYNVYFLPISIISASVATVVFPKFSQNINSESKEELSGQLNNFFRINLFFFVPVTFIFFFYGEGIIELLFQRGEFKLQDTIMTAELLKIYSLSLVFYSSYAALNKLLYSAALVKQLLVITIIGCVIKILLNFILVHPMQQSGLALSTTISFVFFFAAASAVVIAKIKMNNKTVFIKEMLLVLINASISFMIVYILDIKKISDSVLLADILSAGVFLIIFILNAYFIQSKALDMALESAKIIKLPGLRR